MTDPTFQELKIAAESLNKEFGADPDEARGLYETAHNLGWSLLKKTPKDRQLYGLINEIERSYRTLQTILSLENGSDIPDNQIDQHFFEQTYNLYTYAIKNDPQWASAWFYLGDRDALEGRCEQAKQRFLKGIGLGNDAEGVEYCFYTYINNSTLAVLDQMPVGASKCWPAKDMEVAQAIEEIDRDWQALKPHVSNLNRLGLVKTVDRYNRLKLAYYRVRAGWQVLQKSIPATFLSEVKYKHIHILAWPWLFGKGYKLRKAVENLGLLTAWQVSDTSQRTVIDWACQRIYFQIDENDYVAELEQKLLTTADETIRQDLFQFRLMAGDFDGAIDAVLNRMTHLKNQLEKSRHVYENAWNNYSELLGKYFSPDKLLEDYFDDGEPKLRKIWNDLAFASYLEMETTVWLLNVLSDELLIIDWIRRIGSVHQPWFGRFLIKRTKLRSWLESTELFEYFAQNHRFLEIDHWLGSLKPNVSDSWHRQYNRMIRTAELLEERLERLPNLDLSPSLGSLLGQDIWDWLDEDSKLFLHTGEGHHRRLRFMVRSEQDFSGVFAFYYKALEVTLTRAVLVEPYGEVKERGGWTSRQEEIMKRRISSKLPSEGLRWFDELTSRMDKVRNKRNDSLHRNHLPFAEYMELRHLVMGTRYEGIRTVSMFWLAYALCHLLI